MDNDKSKKAAVGAAIATSALKMKMDPLSHKNPDNHVADRLQKDEGPVGKTH